MGKSLWRVSFFVGYNISYDVRCVSTVWFVGYWCECSFNY